MKINTLTLMIVFVTASMYSQWHWQNPWPQGNALMNVWVFDSLNVLAVGDHGVVLRTADNGSLWDVQYVKPDGIPSTAHFILGSLSFVGRDTGWVLGGMYNTSQPAFVFRTIDGGRSWQHFSTIYREVFNIFFVTDRIGWVVGNNRGNILKTTDSGYSWIDQSNDLLMSMANAYFRDSLNGWVVGIHGFIAKTTDGGTTWIRQYLDRGDVAQLLSVQFVDSNNGWAVGSTIGEGYIARTTDGGMNWLTQLLLDERIIFRDVYFINANVGFVIGMDGKIFKTVDGGLTWKSFQTESRNTLIST